MFVALAEASNINLSEDELERFEESGSLGPYPLLTATGVESLYQTFTNEDDRFSWKNLSKSCEQSDFKTYPWFKSLHAYLRPFCDLAAHPAIIERLSSLLGPDIIVWGVSVTTRSPGQVHRWHVDVEHVKWPGIR
jgi:hypothetical protein